MADEKLLEDRILEIEKACHEQCTLLSLEFDRVTMTWWAGLGSEEVVDSATFIEMIEALEAALDL